MKRKISKLLAAVTILLAIITSAGLSYALDDAMKSQVQALAQSGDINGLVALAQANPDLAAEIAAIAAAANQELATQITVAIATALPDMAPQITASVAAALPDMAVQITTAVVNALPDKQNDIVAAVINVVPDPVKEDIHRAFNPPQEEGPKQPPYGQ
jgi:hypothetical protein